MAAIKTVKGAKAGQKEPRKPNISKDTVASISTAKLLYGLAEGEVYGLADGAKSIRLDGTPLIDDAGNPNFEGVTWDFRRGTNDQDYIKGFPDVSNETPINVELKSSQPWIKALNDTQISAVRVRFKWNRLSETNASNGDVKGYKIDYAIDLQTDGGAYQTVLTTKIQDKTSAGYERTHRIDLPKAKTGWQLRVRRITPNSTSDLIQDTMMIDAIAEVIDVKLAYPNTALLGIQYNAELFSNIAKMSVRVKGKIIRVPDNYDPVARTYTGIWTGNFKDAYSNNPAWIFYDLCTQWRGGLGERLDATMIDRWSLYALGQYCDQKVSDGQGGLEPRFTCNVYLQKQEEAYTVLQNIAGIFRAMSFWTGERIMLDADVPQDPIYTYSAANIVGGVAGIQYSGTRNRDRHTLAKVAWDNPANDYQTEYEYIRDEKAMSKFGVKVLDLSAFGCTSQAQAQRAGLWALKTEQLETRQVTFSVGLDGAIPRVGNIISLSDEAFAGRANGGRVSAVSDAQYVITLDRDVTVNIGDTLIVNGGSGKSERRNIKSVSGRKITVTAPFTSAEREHVWAVEAPDLKLMRFRVMSITENDDATYAITAIQHEPQKYDAIDFGTDVKPTEITIVNPETVDAPVSVAITSRHREVQAQTVATLIISWSQVKGAVAYDAEWRKDDGTWVKVPRTGNVSVEIDGVYSGNYMARVRAISAFDVQSQPTSSILTEVKGKIGLPPTIVGLTATGVLFGMNLKWGFATGSGDAAYTEIQVGSAPNVNVATLTQVSYPTNTHTVTGLQGNLKQSYRARLVDKLGFKSPWSAWVTGTTDANADKVMDLIEGQIRESSLNTALTTKIGKIETNATAITAEQQARIAGLLAANEGITTETTQRKAADVAINSRVDTVVSKTDGNTAAIASEVTARTSADGALSTRIDTVVAKSGDNTAAIIAEATARTNADSAQVNRLNALDAKTNATNGRVGSLETVTANQTEAIAKTDREWRAEFNGLEIGGRNLIPNSKEFNSRRWGGAYSATSTVTIGKTVAEWGTDEAAEVSYSGGTNVVRGAVAVTVGAGNLCTWSCHIKNVSGGTLTIGTNGLDGAVITPNTIANGKWARVVITGTCRTSYDWWQVFITATSTSSSGKVQVWQEKAELGNKATDWTPAPEDVDSAIAVNSAAIQQETQARADAVGAVASNVTTLQTTVNGHTASIQTAQSSINGINLQYTVKLDSGGKISGFGLMNDGATSAFDIRADRFSISAPVGKPNDVNGTSPLMVLTNQQVIDGVTVPAGVYARNFYAPRASIDTIQIKDAAIKTAQIDNLAVTTAKIANLAVKSAQIDNLAVTSGKIANLAVDTLQIAGNAITVPISTYSAGEIAVSERQGDTKIQSITIPNIAGDKSVLISFLHTVMGTEASSSSMYVRVLLNGTALRSALISRSNAYLGGSFSMGLLLNPSQHGELEVFGFCSGNPNGGTASARFMSVIITKR